MQVCLCFSHLVPSGRHGEWSACRSSRLTYLAFLDTCVMDAVWSRTPRVLTIRTRTHCSSSSQHGQWQGRSGGRCSQSRPQRRRHPTLAAMVGGASPGGGAPEGTFMLYDLFAAVSGACCWVRCSSCVYLWVALSMLQRNCVAVVSLHSSASCQAFCQPYNLILRPDLVLSGRSQHGGQYAAGAGIFPDDMQPL